MTQVVEGDIWEHHNDGSRYIVIPTNIGWKTNGHNVMGAGLALQAKTRYPSSPTSTASSARSTRRTPR